MLRRFGAFDCKNLFARFKFNSFRLFLLLSGVTVCTPGTVDELVAYHRHANASTRRPQRAVYRLSTFIAAISIKTSADLATAPVSERIRMDEYPHLRRRRCEV